MKELLDEFICTVTEENRTVIVSYSHPTYSHSGSCTYESHQMKGISKPIIQNFLIMTGCDMGDVIEYIYQTRGLSEKDFDEVNMIIREHSRTIVEKEDPDPLQS
jgi:hypothetical protein